jgi:hypothetical protein
LEISDLPKSLDQESTQNKARGRIARFSRVSAQPPEIKLIFPGARRVLTLNFTARSVSFSAFVSPVTM